jgi:hypothetical protein
MAITLLEFVNRIGWEIDQTEFNNAIGNVGRAVDKLKPAVGRLNLIVTGAFTALSTLSLKAASDATEVQNKFNQTFSEMRETANTFASEFADSLNKSDAEVQESLANFQAFTVGLGFGQQEAFGMSTRLQQLSADFGSFNNLSDGESQQRFISAMSGSSEVVDRFGINLKQANLELKLQELGLASSMSQATEMQKSVARLAIIEESLGRQGALGDAQRTLGDFASTARGVKATLVDLAASFGKVILPIANLIGKGLLVMLKLLEATPTPLKVIIVLLGFLLTLATNTAVAVLFFVGALIALNGWLVRSGISIGTMTASQIANVAIMKIQSAVTMATAIATKLYSMAMGQAGIATIISSVAMKVATVVSALLSGGMLTLGSSVAVATAGISLIIPLIVGLIVGIVAAVKAIKRGTGEVGKFGRIFQFIGAVIKTWFNIVTFIPKLLWNIFDALSDILLTFLGPIFDVIANMASPLFDALDKIEEKFGTFENFLFELMVRLLMPLAEFQIAVSEWADKAADAFGGFFDNIKQKILEFMDSPAGKVLQAMLKNSPAAIIGGGIVDAVSGFVAGPQVATAGRSPVPGVSARNISMTNEISNVIEIGNGMSAREAEDVIVRANRRSFQQQANDALRNTSGVD